MAGIGRFKLSDALGNDPGASKTAKGEAKEKKRAKVATTEPPTHGHMAEMGRGNHPTGHQKVVGGGRGA
jgi:hypothetical protein